MCARYTPQRVKRLPVDAQQSSCGGNHTVFVGTKGGVFVAGRGTNGCLGLGKSVPVQDVPVQVPALEGIRVRFVHAKHGDGRVRATFCHPLAPHH